MAKVYISSTFRDLKDEREAAARAIRRLGHQTVAMEDYVAADQRPLARCLADVRDCQLYVCIVAWRYGFIPHGHDASITQLEYEEAGNVGIPRLIFILDESARWPPACVDTDRSRIDRFRRDLVESERHLVSLFATSEQLAELLSASVSRTLASVVNRPPLAPILPYLCDRSDQESELANAWLAHQTARPRRPLVCVIHGDELECHDAFVERLQVVSVPRLVKTAADVGSVRGVFVPWPSSYGSRATRVQAFRRNLARSVAEVIPDDRDRTPILLHTYLLTENWWRHGRAIVDEFLRFWTEYQDAPPHRLLLVCLCFRHQRPPRSLARRVMFAWANRGMRRFLRTLSFDGFANVTGMVLPELTAIGRGEAEEWIRTKHVKDVCDIHHMMAEVRSLYERRELCTSDGYIPMERLAPELRRLLIKYRL